MFRLCIRSAGSAAKGWAYFRPRYGLGFVVLFCGLLLWGEQAMVAIVPDRESATLAAFGQGLLYPLLHLNHWILWIVLGLLATTRPQGLALPITWAVVAIAGTCLPLWGLELPVPQALVALSLLGLGSLLWNRVVLPEACLISIGALLALCQGYTQAELLAGNTFEFASACLMGLLVSQLGLGLAGHQLGLLCLWHRAERAAVVFAWIGYLLTGASLANLGFNMGL